MCCGLLFGRVYVIFTAHVFHSSCMPSDLTVRWVLVILTLFGFIIFDLAYIATVINYCCQCHLLTCLILGLKERLLMRAVAVDEAIKVRNVLDLALQPLY